MLKAVRWGRLQITALVQIILISIQLGLGFYLLVISAIPEFGGSSVNTFNQIAVLLFAAFLAPAIPTLISASVLCKSPSKVTDEALRSARRKQMLLFVFCILALVPAISLAINGFWPFAIDCVLGIIFWVIVNKETSGLGGSTK